MTRPIALTLLVTSTFWACGKKQSLPPPQKAAVTQPAAVPSPEPAKEKPVYVYSGDRFRDPFTPTGQSSSYQPDAVFDPQRATVKGIIFGPKLQSAVVMVGGTGTYFVRGGHIYDIMGKMVDGFSAKIFIDKVSVKGESDTSYELKLQDPQEGKTP